MTPRPNRSTIVFTFLLVASAAACGVSKPPKSKDAGAMDGGSTGGRSTGGTGATDAGGVGGSRGGGGSSGAGGAGGAGGVGGTGGAGGTGGSASGGAAGTAGGRGGGNAGAGGIGGASPGGNGGGGSTGLLQLPVNLRTAANYVILAKSGISTVPPSVITGNLGVSPATATAITQFSLIADSTNIFWSSSQVTGKVYAADNAVPTPTNLTTAVNDMELAFTEAAGRAPMVTELGAGTIGGMTLAPGVYKWGSGVLIPTNVTLNGSLTDVWIFQIAQGLTVSNGARVALTGGAVPKNVFWQVAGSVMVGTTAHLEGVVLTQTSATLQTGSSMVGRLLAQTAVTLDTSTVTQPSP